MRFHCLTAGFVLLAAAPASGLAQGGVDFPPLIEATVPTPPTVASGSDGRILSYELHLTSFEQADCTLDAIQVFDDATGEVIVVLRDSALIHALVLPGRGLAGAGGNKLASGQRVIAFLWIPLVEGRRPAQLRHRLVLRRGDHAATTATTGDKSSLCSLRKAIICRSSTSRARWPKRLTNSCRTVESWLLATDPAMDAVSLALGKNGNSTAGGRGSRHSNLMFMTAGVLAERITGQTWEELVRQRIFVPLGMTRSNFSVTDLARAKRKTRRVS